MSGAQGVLESPSASGCPRCRPCWWVVLVPSASAVSHTDPTVLCTLLQGATVVIPAPCASDTESAELVPLPHSLRPPHTQVVVALNMGEWHNFTQLPKCESPGRAGVRASCCFSPLHQLRLYEPRRHVFPTFP